MKSNAELKALAKDNLHGRWLVAILVTVVAWLLTGAFESKAGRETVDYVWRNGELVETVINPNGSNSLYSLLSADPSISDWLPSI